VQFFTENIETILETNFLESVLRIEEFSRAFLSKDILQQTTAGVNVTSPLPFSPSEGDPMTGGGGRMAFL